MYKLLQQKENMTSSTQKYNQRFKKKTEESLLYRN